jgi:hypothetical protein
MIDLREITLFIYVPRKIVLKVHHNGLLKPAHYIVSGLEILLYFFIRKGIIPLMKRIFLTAIIILSFASGMALAAPQPAIVPKAGTWTLEVKFEQPLQMVLQSGNSQERFWYIILDLVNQSGKDIDFYPQFELVTDTIQVTPAIKGTSAVLFDKIKDRHKSKYPFLQLPENAPQKMLQGEDNAIDIAVIFPDFDPNAKTVNIFISGLSNETVAVDNPAEKDKDGNPVKIYLRKTLQLTYSIAGDPKFRNDQKLKFVAKSWVMR